MLVTSYHPRLEASPTFSSIALCFYQPDPHFSPAEPIAGLKNFSPEHPWVEVVENSLSSVSTVRVKSSVHTLRERITEENVEWEQNLVLVNVRIRVIILRVQLSEILSKLPMIGQLKDFQVRSLRLAE